MFISHPTLYIFPLAFCPLFPWGLLGTFLHAPNSLLSIGGKLSWLVKTCVIHGLWLWQWTQSLHTAPHKPPSAPRSTAEWGSNLGTCPQTESTSQVNPLACIRWPQESVRTSPCWRQVQTVFCLQIFPAPPFWVMLGVFLCQLWSLYLVPFGLLSLHLFSVSQHKEEGRGESWAP